MELDSSVSALRDLSSLLDVLDNQTSSWGLNKTLLVGGGVVRQTASVGNAERHVLQIEKTIRKRGSQLQL